MLPLGRRPSYGVAELAGFGAEFQSTGEFEVLERRDGIGMTDFYGVSGRVAAPEYDPMPRLSSTAPGAQGDGRRS